MENKEKEFYIPVNGQKVQVSEEIYRAWVRPIRKERRRKQRAFRCQVKGPKGKLIRCQKDCRECPYAIAGNNALGNNLSLDRLKDDGVEIEDRRLDVEQSHIDNEEKQALYAAIEQLTPRQKEIVHLIYFEEKTQEEAAEKLGISQATVSVTLERAIENLKNTIKI